MYVMLVLFQISIDNITSSSIQLSSRNHRHSSTKQSVHSSTDITFRTYQTMYVEPLLLNSKRCIDCTINDLDLKLNLELTQRFAGKDKHHLSIKSIVFHKLLTCKCSVSLCGLTYRFIDLFQLILLLKSKLLC